VKVPSIRLRYDSLSAHADQTRFLESEAGNRAQLDIRCGITLALMGRSYGETEPRKANYQEAGHNIQNPTLLEIIPAAFFFDSGLSPGNPAVELATPNGTKQSY
jgi:hypothetical protein